MEVGNKHNLNFRRLELDIGHFLVKLLIQSPRSSYVLFQGIKITIMHNVRKLRSQRRLGEIAKLRTKTSSMKS